MYSKDVVGQAKWQNGKVVLSGNKNKKVVLIQEII